MKKFKTLLLALTAISSVNVAAAEQGWTGPHLVKLVDSATASKNNSLVTLEGYSNGICSSDRIFLSIEDDQKFNQLFSIRPDLYGGHWATGVPTMNRPLEIFT